MQLLFVVMRFLDTPPTPPDNVEIFEPLMDSSAFWRPLKINVEMGGGGKAGIVPRHLSCIVVITVATNASSKGERCFCHTGSHISQSLTYERAVVIKGGSTVQVNMIYVTLICFILQSDRKESQAGAGEMVPTNTGVTRQMSGCLACDEGI